MQAALDARQSGRSLTTPIDRDGMGESSNLYSAVTPARYDTVGNGGLFGTIYGIGTYMPPKAIPQLTLQNVPSLEQLAPSVYLEVLAAAIKANEPVVEQDKDTSNGA